MACSSTGDSNEIKPECKDFCINISGEGSCQIKKIVCPAAGDSTKIKLECKELLIDIPAKKARRAATDIIEDILTSNAVKIPQDMEPARLPKSCIFKVPEKLRHVNKKAYNPKLISIGPLHHGQEELEEMELQKLKYFKEFFDRKRTTKITPMDLRSIIDENKEKTIRQCYATDTSKFISKEFISMILLDAVFIIELFLRNAMRSKQALYDLVALAVPNLLPSVRDKSNKDADDYMFSDKWLSYHLRLDLLLLENQLPFFILKELWEKSNCYSSSDHQKEEEKNGEATEDNAKDDACFFAKLWEKSNCYSGSGHHKEEEQNDDPTEKEDTSFLTLAFAYFYELHPEHEQKPPSPKKKKSTDSHAAFGCFNAESPHRALSRGPTTSAEAAKSCMEIEHPLTDRRRCINSGKKFKDVNQHFTYFRKYAAQSKDGEKVKHFTDMLRYFFYSPEMKEVDGKCTELSKKFTSEFRTYFCFCSDDESEDGEFIQHLYSATQLEEAGVKFKRVKHRPLLDIKFKTNMCLKYFPFLNFSWVLSCLPCFTCLKIMQPFLEVPTFQVNDETECVFRNLMAYEQCQCSPPDDSELDPNYICNYILLLDRFINSKEDVDLLVDEKVIVNFLGSNKRVATLVNDLCLEIVEPEKSQFMDLSERLNKHYANYWNKNMAKLSRRYFGDFWRGTATVVGLIVLVFTLWNFQKLLFRHPKGFPYHK